MPCITPLELDRAGMAFGEVGFSLNIWEVGSQSAGSSDVRIACDHAGRITMKMSSTRIRYECSVQDGTVMLWQMGKRCNVV